MKKVIIINSETMGNGNSELGATLMGAFLRKLWASPKKPEAIILYNGGVKLAAEGSAVLDALEGLLDAGVDILACGTCVEYFGLGEKMKKARVSNMVEITEYLMNADDTVTI